MKSAFIFTVALAAGTAGMLLFFGDHENMTTFLLSKAIGMTLLLASYKLYNRFKSWNQSTYQTTYKSKHNESI